MYICICIYIYIYMYTYICIFIHVSDMYMCNLHDTASGCLPDTAVKC